MSMDSKWLAEEQAAQWLSRRSSARFSAADEQQFQDWLGAATQNTEAFAALQRIWADFSQVPRPVLAPVRAAPPRRHWLRHAAAAACIVAGLLFVQSDFSLSLVSEQSFASNSQTVREVELADGSRVMLNLDSRIQVRYFEDRREVVLEQGAAFFSVAHDASRPFTVHARDSQVQVLGTRFSVLKGDEHLAVAVEQGRVRFSARQGEGGEATLTAGDAADLNYASGELERSRQTPAEIASWRNGQLIFRNRPLGQLADELSHYRQAPVRLTDPALAQLRVSGSLDIHRPDAFLDALPHLLAVRVERLADGQALIRTAIK